MVIVSKVFVERGETSDVTVSHVTCLCHLQSLECLWTRMAAGVEATISNGVDCLCPSVSQCVAVCPHPHQQLSINSLEVVSSDISGPVFIFLCTAAYREPYLFVTYFNSLDVIEVQSHSALG